MLSIFWLLLSRHPLSNYNELYFVPLIEECHNSTKCFFTKVKQKQLSCSQNILKIDILLHRLTVLLLSVNKKQMSSSINLVEKKKIFHMKMWYHCYNAELSNAVDNANFTGFSPNHHQQQRKISIIIILKINNYA